jgi:homoserine dehydrogenase
VKAACTSGGTHYGDAATVGAGLPVLSSLRRLLACGDRLHRLEGVFSGSLSWLFNDFDEHAAFSQRLALARSHGYTEPDPREDLSGGDVARKLLILARAAGFPLQLEQLEVENLVPDGLRDGGVDAFLDQVAALDGPLQARVQAARERGHVLRYLAQLDGDGHARVGLCEVGPAHPAAALHGTDNQFVITTDRYRERPLVIGGPGAGPEVTAQALLGDLLDCTPAATLLRAAA